MNRNSFNGQSKRRFMFDNLRTTRINRQLRNLRDFYDSNFSRRTERRRQYNGTAGLRNSSRNSRPRGNNNFNSRINVIPIERKFQRLNLNNNWNKQTNNKFRNLNNNNSNNNNNSQIITSNFARRNRARLAFTKKRSTNSNNNQFIRSQNRGNKIGSLNKFDSRIFEVLVNKPEKRKLIRLSRKQRRPNISRKNNINGNERNSNKLHIENISLDTNNTELFNLFSPYGKIINCSIIYEENGKSTGIGIAEFLNSNEAKVALRDLNGNNLLFLIL